MKTPSEKDFRRFENIAEASMREKFWEGFALGVVASLFIIGAAIITIL